MTSLHKIIIEARLLEKEPDACPFNIETLRAHYDLNTTDAIYVKEFLDRDKERG